VKRVKRKDDTRAAGVRGWGVEGGLCAGCCFSV